MGIRSLVVGITTIGVALTMAGGGAATAAGTDLACQPLTLNTLKDTPVPGQIICTTSTGVPLTYSLRPFVADQYGPFSGKLDLNPGTGTLMYTPGFYPPDASRGGVQDPLPDWTGYDTFTIVATAPDGTSAAADVTVNVDAPATACDPNFVAATTTMFNDPAGDQNKQYQMLRHMVNLIDCVPARNDDGTQASIKFSFYSLTYAPVQSALVNAAKRGVSVQALTNSHADKYVAWKSLARNLGPDTAAVNFATTCWAGCNLPRFPPPPGGPTSWYSAEATNLTGKTVVFSDRSFVGTSGAPIVSWQWDLGDGTTPSGPGPITHTYAEPGEYLTSLTVTDAAGLSHTTTGKKTMPDNMEPMYPSLHSKVYLFSQVGTGANARQWVSGYSSGNPTYQQARKGFNNFNIAVGDKSMYDILVTYFNDMVAASRGALLTTNYFRSFSTPGNPATGAPATNIHFGPQTVGDINRDILSTVQCRYQDATGAWQRTRIRVSMFVFTRTGVARDIWRLAFEQGCTVDITYTQMNQRLKDRKGRWLANEDGEIAGYGVADCLSTPPTKKVRGRTVRNTLGGPTAKNPGAPYCNGGTLKGKVPVKRDGIWLDRKSSITGGSIKIQMSCPVAPYYDAIKKLWSVVCIRNDIFTHQKVMIVDGWIRGAAQKYVMSGSSNWSSPGLRASDEIITEIQNAPELYTQQYVNMDYLDSVIRRNTANTPSSSNKPKDGTKKTSVAALAIPDDAAQVDVTGMDFGHDQE